MLLLVFVRIYTATGYSIHVFSFNRAYITGVTLICSVIVSACSGSGSNTDDVPSTVAMDAVDTDSVAVVVNDDATAGGTANSSVQDQLNGLNLETDETPSNLPVAEGAGESASETVDTPVDTPPNAIAEAVPDPTIPLSTRLDIDVTVPAYVSNALQLELEWGDQSFKAEWVGDQFWFVSADLPVNTEHPLIVTFFDDNGDIILGRYEQNYKTGTNASESLRITANQFDTERWDSDEDGVSNLAELIAGTDAFGLPRVLLFSETRGYRHPSIPNALDALETLAASDSIQVNFAGDSSGVFTDENLAEYDAIVWVLTSGDVLDDSEQAAFEQYIRAGGGYAGIHAASDTEYEWPWYGSLVGAYFEQHPEIQSATQIVEDGSHPSTSHLSASWTRRDEWYDYSSNPRARVNVLLRLDENSYTGGIMGNDHPSAWYHNYDGGRSWYTGGGHTPESYAEPAFRTHLLGGLRYAAGLDG